METGEATDDFTRRVNEIVREVRQNKKWRAEYMHTLVHEQDIRDEGIAIGKRDLIKNALLRGKTPEMISEFVDVRLEEVIKIKKELEESVV